MIIMKKKFRKINADIIYDRNDEGQLIPISGINHTITYKEGFEDRGILTNGNPVIREKGRWVLLN